MMRPPEQLTELLIIDHQAWWHQELDTPVGFPKEGTAPAKFKGTPIRIFLSPQFETFYNILTILDLLFFSKTLRL